MPVLRSDDRPSAERRAREFADKKFTHFWDSNRLTGRLWQRVLNQRDTPWDVYYLYDADAQWEKEPTAPDFKIRRVNGVTKARLKLKIESSNITVKTSMTVNQMYELEKTRC